MAYFHKYKVYKTGTSPHLNEMPTTVTNHLPEITLFKQITITPLINQIIENLSHNETTTTISSENTSQYDNYWDSYDYDDDVEITSSFVFYCLLLSFHF
jgi:hypothetical protein